MAETKEVPAWTYEHPADHPDNKPPLTLVAVPSDEDKKQYEDSVNAQIAKYQPETLTKEQAAVDPFVRVQLVDPPEGSAKKGATEPGSKPAKVDYDEKTVAELKELAAERGVEIHWDARKDEIIKALEKQDKAKT
jgi:hypothetical protein